MRSESVRLTEEELAHRAGVTVERVRELARAGLLPAGDDPGAPFQMSDVMRVEVVEATERAGVPLADLAQAVASGRLSLQYLDSLPQPGPLLHQTCEDLAREEEVPFEVIARLFGAFGIPVPNPSAWVREDDAFVFRAASIYLRAGLSPESLYDAARVYGDAFRHLAQYQVDLFHAKFEEPYRERGVRESDLLGLAVADVASQTAQLGTQLVAYLYERHSETYQVQHRVEHAELTLEEAGLHRRGVTDPPSIVFLDLTGYTALTEQRGDEVSAEIAIRLASFVEEPTRRYGGHVVKWLGDGVELFFPKPAAAVRCSLELEATTDRADLPAAHIGVNAGQVVYRSGDYYGRTVNIAARIASVATAHQVLVSDTVVQACGGADLEFRHVGGFELKGMSDRVDLYRATAAACTRHSPEA